MEPQIKGCREIEGAGCQHSPSCPGRPVLWGGWKGQPVTKLLTGMADENHFHRPVPTGSFSWGKRSSRAQSHQGCAATRCGVRCGLCALQALSPLQADSWSLRSGSWGDISGKTSDSGEPGLCRPREAEDCNVLFALGRGWLDGVLLSSQCWTKASSESSDSLYGPFGSKRGLRSVHVPGGPYRSDKCAEILLNCSSFHQMLHLGTWLLGLALPWHLCPWDVPSTIRDGLSRLWAAWLCGERRRRAVLWGHRSTGGDGEEDGRYWARWLKQWGFIRAASFDARLHCC